MGYMIPLKIARAPVLVFLIGNAVIGVNGRMHLAHVGREPEPAKITTYVRVQRTLSRQLNICLVPIQFVEIVYGKKEKYVTEMI